VNQKKRASLEGRKNNARITGNKGGSIPRQEKRGGGGVKREKGEEGERIQK